MKKLIVLFSLLMLAACSSSDKNDDGSGSGSNGKNYFNPPAWIIGSWSNRSDGNGTTYIFTKDDIKILQGGTTTSYKEQSANLEKSGVKVTVTEANTNNTYTADYSYSTTSTTRYSFTKLSDTQIESTGFLSGTYTKQ